MVRMSKVVFTHIFPELIMHSFNMTKCHNNMINVPLFIKQRNMLTMLKELVNSWRTFKVLKVRLVTTSGFQYTVLFLFQARSLYYTGLETAH